MRNLLICLALLLISLSSVKAQDTMYVHQSGLVTKIPVAKIDSGIFYNYSNTTDTLFVRQQGNVLSSFPFSTIDSVTFYNSSDVFAFGILNKLKGIWNGPLHSTTALGDFPEWIVDFRPISENQISAKNELDSLNDIHMSFFIVKYNNRMRVGFRNGGTFSGMQRVSYFIADSVSETSNQSFYRFVEYIKGKDRAYTTVKFNDDSLILKAYTNIYNSLPTATLHFAWTAKLQDATSYQPAVAAFGFPKKTMTKDFSNTFNGLSESMYYSTSGPAIGDPYTESMQPYLGQTTINYTFSSSYTPVAANKVIIVVTTQPLLNGFSYNAANLKTRSRYVLLPSDDHSYTFNYMHPGSYYVYAFYDADGNNVINSGDWFSAVNTPFSLSPLGTSSANVQINFTIP